MTDSAPLGPADKTARGWRLASAILLQLVCYFAVNQINNLRPSSHLLDFGLSIDAQIPYLPWTWIIYYLGPPYMSIWAFAIVWHLPQKIFRLAMKAYFTAIAAGALLQLLLPARSPWPLDPAPFQKFMHLRISYDPYVCLPSMHVALCILPACLAFHSFSSRLVCTISLAVAVLISLSTLTLKEHYFLDSLAGLLLGLACYGWILIRSRQYS